MWEGTSVCLSITGDPGTFLVFEKRSYVFCLSLTTCLIPYVYIFNSAFITQIVKSHQDEYLTVNNSIWFYLLDIIDQVIFWFLHTIYK